MSDLEDAGKFIAWLEAEPERAVQIIKAGLAMLAVHGYQPAEGPPLRWIRTDTGPE